MCAHGPASADVRMSRQGLTFPDRQRRGACSDRPCNARRFVDNSACGRWQTPLNSNPSNPSLLVRSRTCAARACWHADMYAMATLHCLLPHLNWTMGVGRKVGRFHVQRQLSNIQYSSLVLQSHRCTPLAHLQKWDVSAEPVYRTMTRSTSGISRWS
jgi:hypothetical protein